MAFKAWKYTGYTFDSCINAYFKDGEGGCPAYTLGYMVKHVQHLREI